jgi:prepilin-type N-terminal cleavage/methylation domain-containing protein
MRAERGLTLLEVMAAVALLGMVYAVLARAATHGVMAEGDSRRRMEASLLADLVLADIEIGLADGELPAEGPTQSEQDDFEVAVEVVPYELPEALKHLRPKPDSTSPNVFGAAGGEGGLLRQITVRISWFDGIDEKSVERVTLGLDLAMVEQLATGGLPGGEVR